MEPRMPQRRPAVRGNCRGIGYTGTQRTLQMRLRPFRAEASMPRLETDHHPGQASFAQRGCAHDGEVSTQPHARANSLSAATCPK